MLLGTLLDGLSLGDVKNAVSTLNLVNGKVVHIFTEQDSEYSQEIAQVYLNQISQNSYTCVVCNQRVRNFKKTLNPESAACLFASSLCFTCHFWLSKVGNPRFMIVNGRSYSFAQPHTVDQIPQDEPLHRTFSYVASSLSNKSLTFERNKVWQQGTITEACRPYLPDTHEWICPRCFSVMYKGDPTGQFGYICTSCREQVKQQEALEEAARREEYKAEYDAWHNIDNSDHPMWEVVLESAYQQHENFELNRISLELEAEWEQAQRDHAVECTCTEEQATEPGPWIDKCFFCQKMGMQEDEQRQKEEDEMSEAYAALEASAAL